MLQRIRRGAILRRPFDKLERESDAQFSRLLFAFPAQQNEKSASIFIYLFFSFSENVTVHPLRSAVLRNVLYFCGRAFLTVEFCSQFWQRTKGLIDLFLIHFIFREKTDADEKHSVQF